MKRGRGWEALLSRGREYLGGGYHTGEVVRSEEFERGFFSGNGFTGVSHERAFDHSRRQVAL